MAKQAYASQGDSIQELTFNCGDIIGISNSKPNRIPQTLLLLKIRSMNEWYDRGCGGGFKLTYRPEGNEQRESYSVTPEGSVVELSEREWIRGGFYIPQIQKVIIPTTGREPYTYHAQSIHIGLESIRKRLQEDVRMAAYAHPGFLEVLLHKDPPKTNDQRNT